MEKPNTIIIGAGPAGTAAAYELSINNIKTVILEKTDQIGGLSRTIKYKDCLFDIGPHRFFTSIEEIKNLYNDVLGLDAIPVNRHTRIYYNNVFFDYPLTPFQALKKLGFQTSISIMISYLCGKVKSLIKFGKKPITFEDWVSARFGQKLYTIFFKTYTEKVWGIPCSSISSDWASQRIKNLTLVKAITSAIFKSHKKNIKTLADQFLYPKLGAGQFYEKMTLDCINNSGSKLLLNSEVKKIKRKLNKVIAIEYEQDNEIYEITADHFISSMPLTELIFCMDPPAPENVIKTAKELRFRNHICVNFITNNVSFPDNWIYVHSPDVKMARIANYKSFTDKASKAPDIFPVTVEYFVYEEDVEWKMSEKELIDLASKEMQSMQLMKKEDIIDAFVVKSDFAYPVQDLEYQDRINIIKEWLQEFQNLTPIGRAGMFKYNNQDHSIATGLLAARNIYNNKKYNIWDINTDASYQEAKEV